MSFFDYFAALFPVEECEEVSIMVRPEDVLLYSSLDDVFMLSIIFCLFFFLRFCLEMMDDTLRDRISC